MSPRNLQTLDLDVNTQGVVVKGMMGKPGILLVWAAFCGHCTRFKPTFSELDSRIGIDFNVVALEDKQLTRQISTSLGIGGYPTLKFFDKAGKVVSDYNGDRSLDSLLSHICKFYHTCAAK
jgi:thiol-disulfide isomerase/thioredoxin